MNLDIVIVFFDKDNKAVPKWNNQPVKMTIKLSADH